MSLYPPNVLVLFALSFTRTDCLLVGSSTAEIAYRPQGRILPFWWAFLGVCLAVMLSVAIWGDIGLVEWICLLAAMAGIIAFALADHLLPRRGGARIARGKVTRERAGQDGAAAEQWSEPLSAYRGLRACREDWSELPAMATARWADGRSVSRRPISQRPSMRIPRSRLWVFLEHATDPSRSLLLLRQEGAGLIDPIFETLATRLELAWLEEIRVSRPSPEITLY